MKSFRIPARVMPAVAALWLASCGGSSAPGGSAPTVAPGSAALIHTA